MSTGASNPGSIKWTCESCGRSYDAAKVFPVFDFTKRKTHCGCLDGMNRA